MRLEIIRQRQYGDARDLLAEICSAFADRVALEPELAVAADVAVRLVLGGNEEAEQWDVAAGHVGFFAVISARRADGEGDWSEADEHWFDVNEHLEAHVNLDAGLAVLEEDCSDMADLAASLEAWLVTVPHELLHIADWVRETGGRTPLQVFDQGDGELAISRVLRSIENSHEANGSMAEDAVEAAARAMTARVVDGHPISDDAGKVLEEMRLRHVQMVQVGPARQ